MNPGSEPFLELLNKWAHRIVPEKEPDPESPGPLPREFSFSLLFLKILPWPTLALFIATLFWDLQGTFDLPWRSEPVALEGVLRMLSVTGLVGFITNWIAIKMLFYPRQRRPLIGQGLIPSRKDHIVRRLGEQISREIINSDLILRQIKESGLVSRHREKLTDSLRTIVSDTEFRQDLLKVTEHYVTNFLRSPQVQEQIGSFVSGIDFENLAGLEGGILRFYRFIRGNEDLSRKMQEVMQSIHIDSSHFDEKLFAYLDRLPEVLEEKGDVIEDTALSAFVFIIEQINVQKVIVENLQRFDEVRLERLLMRSTSNQLQYIQYLGCLLGILGGLFIWQPLESLIVFSSLAGMIWGLDAFLFSFKKKK